MTISYTHNGPIEIAYEAIGPPDGTPLLLIMGTAGQMLSWPDGFCEELTERGFRVARFDNRDVGLSTHLSEAGPPSQLTMVLRPAAAASYTLTDMAGDALAVMDDLGWRSAHMVGVSEGGMIGQTLAARHPDRVRTLTSISSTPGVKIGKPRWRALARIIKAANPKNVDTVDDVADYLVGLSRAVGSPGYPADEEKLRAQARRVHPRGGIDAAAVQRQTAAVVAAGDRRAELNSVTAPTLVLHGDDDPLILPEGGRATAEAIPGAQLVTYPGMGHDLPQALWTDMAERIQALARRNSTSEIGC